MQVLWLYLDFLSLQLDSLYQARQSEDNNVPIVLLDKHDNLVVQLNSAAQACGIRKGMGLGSAAALHRELQVMEYRREVEVVKLEEIARWLYTCTSDISFWPPNGLLLRIQNMLSMYGGLTSYWQAIQARLQPLQLSYRYGCGLTPLAARMLARSGQGVISQECNLLRSRVDDCDLEQTELDGKIRHQLARVGIKRVGQLSAIPPGELAKRFDVQLATYLGRLNGVFHHPVDFYHPPETFVQYLELMYEIENSQVLQHPIRRLLTNLENFLRQRDKLTTELHFCLSLRDTDALEFKVQSAQGEYRAEIWLALTSLKLERLSLPQPAYAIQLSVNQLLENSGQESDLFDGRRALHSPAQLLSRLQAKLGKEAIWGLAAQDDFRPEHSSRYIEPLQGSDTIQWPIPCLRPSLLFEPPRPLTEKVSLLHGPERIQTGWWDSQDVCRDYFIARSAQGQWLWVFRTPQAKWYAHGIFS
ncbi:DNA polymerase Y family protein [Aliiglaciecola sp. CAU 1673]|uniref:Y-family DNA polymerase n=1 Tax=Aliiglaciecola sp. CAU 1673 TaxID=3032595 RepID=UPI0023D9B54E|nr:DNA polymerase Y family protein [Aliiglaciecola sp. CAU 1673]MDF2179298.1 DNA polymerase Y family protein [Aliiglaciecola sp. CAU 1673]